MRMDSNTLKFLEKLKSKGFYLDNIDYSSVQYINSNTKLKLFCKIHKKFQEKRPANILRGEGQCNDCSIEKIKNASNVRKTISDMHSLAKK